MRLYRLCSSFQAITSGDKSRDDRHKVPSLAEKSLLSRRVKYIQKFCLYIQNFCLYKQKFCLFIQKFCFLLDSPRHRTFLGGWWKFSPDFDGFSPDCAAATAGCLSARVTFAQWTGGAAALFAEKSARFLLKNANCVVTLSCGNAAGNYFYGR